MPGEPTFVVVGAGLAGAKTAEALRADGFEGRVVVVGDEVDRPYVRPPLSKGYLQGSADRGSIDVHPADWYAEHDVELQLGSAVTSVDPSTHRVIRHDGVALTYDKLLFATGSTPRRLPVPGADLDGVLTLRRVGDSDRIRTGFARASRMVVIGAGWIGLEVTAAARATGVDVTVLEAAELPLLSVLGREVALVFADLHRAHGVDLRFGVGVTEITGNSSGRVTGVLLANGSRVDADLVVVGVGASPNTELAVGAGLATDNGITVDAHLRTSDPDIFAAGDVANAFHPLLGRHIRVEHWANALNQPAVAARSMLGLDAVYDRLPYFYTDQYELGMEYSGYVEPGGYDEVVFRGDLQGLEFVAFWLRNQRVVAGMNVNIWDVNDTVQALISSRRPVDPSLLTDVSRPLANLLSTG